MEITSQDIEDMNAATQTKSKFVADVADFTDMRVSEVGYGRDEYKTSKPNILRNDAIIAEILKLIKHFSALFAVNITLALGIEIIAPDKLLRRSAFKRAQIKAVFAYY